MFTNGPGGRPFISARDGPVSVVQAQISNYLDEDFALKITISGPTHVFLSLTGATAAASPDTFGHAAHRYACDLVKQA